MISKLWFFIFAEQVQKSEKGRIDNYKVENACIFSFVMN